MPEPVNWGVDPTIADPSSPNYDPDHIIHSEDDFNIARLMLSRGREMSGLAPQNVTVTEGMTVQIWDIPKSVICFLNCEGDLDEITINTQGSGNVSDAQQMAIYATHNIGTVNWTGIVVENAPMVLAATDYWSFRYRAVGSHFIRTVSP